MHCKLSLTLKNLKTGGEKKLITESGLLKKIKWGE
jgi:hypothetical protein